MARTVRTKSKSGSAVKKEQPKASILEHELYQTLFKEAADGIFVSDSQGNYIDVNPRGYKMLGYTRREILRMNLRDLIPAEERKTNPVHIEELLAGKIIVNERSLQCKNGKLLPVEISGRLLSDGNLLDIVRDISARKTAEQVIGMLARFPSENPNPVMRVGFDGKILYANDASQPLLDEWKTGIGRALPKTWKTFLAERTRDRSRVSVDVPCGERVFSILFAPMPEVGYVNVYGRDVTERKQAEAQRESLLEIINTSLNEIYVFNRKTLRFEYVNMGAQRNLGYTLEQLRQMSPLDIKPEFTEDSFREILRPLVEGKQSTLVFRTAHRRADGNNYPVEVHLQLMGQADDSVFLAVIFDITERKRAEEILHQREEQYRTLVEQIPAIVYVDDATAAPGHTVYVSPQIETILGLTPEEWMQGDLDVWVSHIHPDDRQRTLAAYLRCFKNGEPMDSEYRMAAADGRLIWFREQAIRLRDENGKPYLIHGMMYDITERKQAEEKLAASEAELRALFVSMTDVVVIYDADGRYVKIAPTNPINLYRPPENMLGKTVHEVLPKEQADFIVGKIGEAIQTDQAVTGEYALQIGDRELWFAASASRLSENTAIWIAHEITERKQAEQSLRVSEEKFKTLFNSANDSTFTMNHTTFLDCNATTERIFRCSRDQIVGHSPIDFSPERQPDGRLSSESAVEKIEAAFAGQPQTFEWLHTHLDGTPFDAEVSLNRVFIGGGFILQAIVRDITERKRAEEKLRESEARFRGYFELPLVGFAISSPTTQWMDANPTLCKMLGYTKDELMQKNWKEITHPDDMPANMEKFNRALNGEIDNYSLEKRFIRKDGSLIHVDMAVHCLRHPDHTIDYLMSLFLDITERKLAEEGLRALSIRQEAILAAIPDILMEVDINKRYKWANPAGLEFFGEDVLGKEAANYFMGEQNTYEQAEPLFKGNENVIYLESWQKRKDGEKRLLAWQCRTIKDEVGNVTGVISSAHDITESKRYERELEAEAMVAQALSETLELRPLLEQLLEAARHAIPAAEKGSLALITDNEHLQVRAVSGYQDSGVLGFIYPITWGYGGRVVRQRRPSLIADIQKDSELQEAARGTTVNEVRDLRSTIAVPLLVHETVIGVLSLESTQPGVFKEEDLRLLVNFAVSAALIIERARLFEETRRRAEETASLLSTSLALSKLDPQTTLQSIGDHAKTLFAADGCRIFLLEPDGKTLRCVLALLENPVAFTDLKIKLGEGVTGAVAASGQAEIVNDMTGDSRAVQVPGTEEEPEAIMFAPLQEQSRTIGVISIRRVGRKRLFQPADLELLKAFASMAASAVSNTRMLEETRKRVAELETLNRISIAVRAIMNQDEMLAIVLEETLSALNASHGSISLLNEATGKLHKTVARGWLSEFTESPIKPGEGIFGNVFTSGNAHISRDFANDEFTHPEMRSQLRPGWGGVSVPIRSTEKALGVMLVSVPSERELTRDEVRLLNTLAEMTGNALHRMGLYGETVRRAEEFASLYEMHTAISAEHDLGTLLRTIVKNSAALLGTTAGGMYFYDPVNEELQVVVATHSSIPIGMILHLGEGAAGKVAQSRQPLRIDDYATWEGRSQKYETSWIRAVLEVPIIFGGELIGVLVAHEVGASERKFTQADERLLSLYATQAAGAIRSARLHEETQRRLENLQSLREVDRVISSSFDLRPILSTVLSHTITQLGVDAADILMLNPALKTLEYAAGYGFHTRGIERTNLRLGQGHAGRAAFQRRTIRISNLPETGPNFIRASLLKNENFLEYYGVPLISKGEVKGLLEVFHRSHLHLKPEWTELLETLAGQAAIAIDNSQLFESIQRSNIELGLAYEATIEGWSRAMDLRDEETEGHTQRVSDKAISLARALGMQDEEIVHLRRGALLHDIGKIGVPDHILLKTGDLTDEEWVIMRKHPQFAYEMLRPIAYLRPSLDIPYMHHEKWDGTGYPRGFKGEQIPLAARIFAIVDVYDALTSDRPYRKAWTKAETQEYIREQSGKHFDPQVVEKFLQLFGNEAG